MCAQGDCQNGREVRFPTSPRQLPAQPETGRSNFSFPIKDIVPIWRVHLPAAAAMLKPMSDVTRVLAAVERGDPQAAEQLLPLVYDELRKLAAQRLAAEKPGQTLQATALVHEAYVRLVEVDQALPWNSRGHFFAAAAEAMRRILVENARRKKRVRHGGGRQRLDIEVAAEMVAEPLDNLLDLDQALSRLELVDAVAAQVVKLRYFAGLTLPQTADALGLSVRTAERNWTFARTWLHRELIRATAGDDSES